jgi:plasmid stabilization system protein ParE
MTQLVVTADAETDLNEILDYLNREASSIVSEEYGRKFRLYIERLVDSPGIGSPRPCLAPTPALGSCGPTF